MTERTPAEIRNKVRLDAALAALDEAGVDTRELREAITVWCLSVWQGHGRRAKETVR